LLLPTRDGIFARVSRRNRQSHSNFIPLRDTPAEQKPESKAQEPIVLPAIDAQSHWVTEVAPVWVAREHRLGKAPRC
jgi:hypothetical protein